MFGWCKHTWVETSEQFSALLRRKVNAWTCSKCLRSNVEEVD